MAEGKGLFRKEALERLSTPERLDTLLRIVAPRDWLLLATLGGLLLLAVGWSVFGRLPTTVTAPGVFLRPRTVVRVPAPAAGRLTALNVAVGDQVQPGQVIGTVDQADVRKELAEARRQLEQLLEQDSAKGELESKQAGLRREDVAAQRRVVGLKRSNRQRALADADALSRVLERRVQGQEALRAEGLLPAISDALVVARKEFLDNEARRDELRAEIETLDAELGQLQIRERQVDQDLLDWRSSRGNEIRRLEGTMAVLEVRLERDGRVLSERRGRVLELWAAVGDVLEAGAGVVSLATDEAASPLVCRAYFPVRDGKRVQPGMRVLVTPDTVKRERFGGIAGKVREVSAFPVTQQGVLAVVGSLEVAQRLLADGPSIEVTVELEADPSTVSGFRWTSSRGPALEVSPGTTASARVTVEQRAPISYLLPFLRDASGIY